MTNRQLVPDANGVSIRLEAGFATHQPTLWNWIVDRGFATPTAGGYVSVVVPNEFLDSMRSAPLGDDEETIDQWLSEHQLCARLFGSSDVHLHVGSQGFAGAAGFRITFDIDNVRVVSLDNKAFEAVCDGGARIRLSPFVFSTLAAGLVSETASSGERRSRHLATIGALRYGLDEGQRLLVTSPTLTVTLDEHLSAYSPRMLGKARFGWVKDENSDRLSLRVEEEVGPNEYRTVDVTKLDAREPMINEGVRSQILLSRDALEFVRAAYDNQSRPSRRIDAEVLEHPEDLIPEGVDRSGFELAAYSDRVIGFAPSSGAAERERTTSGTLWFEEVDAAGTDFRIAATGTNCAAIEVRPTDADQATKFAEIVEQRLQTADPEPTCVLGDTEVCATPELASGLREAARLWRVGLPPAAALQDQAGDDAPPAAKAGRFVPLLSEQEGSVGEDLDPEIDKTVPWHELESLLKPAYKLLPHQRVGVGWLWSRYLRGASGALLADDMGLGKTLQIASFLALMRRHPRGKDQRGLPILIVSPVMLVNNWYEELCKYFDGDEFPGKVLQLAGAPRDRYKTSSGGLDAEKLRVFDIVLTNYETVARFPKSLLAIDWQCVVLDEAQKIKNPNTAMSKALRGLSGSLTGDRPRKFDFAICSTGTPVENRVDDIWPLFDFLSPGNPFTTAKEFRQRYTEKPDAAHELAVTLNVGRFDSPVLHRKKSQLAQKLPSKTHRTELIPMNEHQTTIERRMKDKTRLAERGALGVLQDLQKLYQHPWLLEPERLNSWEAADLEDAIRSSPKLEATLDILTRIQAANEKVLVFTVWTKMQEMLQRVLLARFGLRAKILNGDTNQHGVFQQHIATFSGTVGFDILILSPLAAGVGLTITAANHVIHYGRWWNPAREDQATDRAYRIGQTKPVTVYYPVLHHPGAPTKGFDVKLNELVERKRGLLRDLFAPADEEISNAELGKVLLGTE